MESRPRLVLLNDRILYSPDGIYDLQCVARTSKGKRCNNPVEPSQTCSWTPMLSKQGVISVYDMSREDDATVSRWLAQHCNTHDKADVIDHQAPEWETFDPAGVHVAVVRPLSDEWVPL